MPATNRPLITSAATGLTAVTMALTGAPWWLAAPAFLCFGLAVLVMAVQSVFPQESEHRLAWWRDRRRHQQLRRQAAARRQPPAGRQQTGGDGGYASGRRRCE
ncbi:hypothetical protein ACIA98_42515 [Streptomyces sp. NPDC051366]|uniref:hypothetical protein n=1 Tax=Streptomyces sp. NPDC051366 TaxID=3365652 RepID=UPI0037904B39